MWSWERLRLAIVSIDAAYCDCKIRRLEGGGSCLTKMSDYGKICRNSETRLRFFRDICEGESEGVVCSDHRIVVVLST